MSTSSPRSAAQEASTEALAPLILLADDSPEDTAFYTENLIAAGFRVATAANGGEAVSLARSLVPDLVVMDLDMPGIDGWEATALLRSHATTVRIPVIAFSGFFGTTMVMRAICAGCSDFVPKPCSTVELQAAVRLALAKGRAKD